MSDSDSSYSTSNEDPETSSGSEIIDDDDDEDYDSDDDFGFDAIKPTNEKREDKIDPVEDELAKRATTVATKALVKEFRAMKALGPEQGIKTELVKDDLFHWHVRLSDFDPKEGLQKDLLKTKDKNILLSVQFPEGFPFDPPYIRVVRPRFQFLTGHVTIGGAICTQLLTKSGWTPAYSMESVIIQLRAGMDEGKARLDLNRHDEYGEMEAKQAFMRFVSKYGWKV
ncbi:ubiquitin-conjugating enzyme family protein [Anaeramoeba ignava]|uniref:Ubiquitin-conjugating enzyme family protein n=1 Tax=Anaeramoeba ignava TaxID=1746090 RepID=A0A9Q0RA96_ANAIG|nr:ubiquitin-conjugating enzyme family protein [Anaeramoeba ignava]